jgi:hypothetical protein
METDVLLSVFQIQVCSITNTHQERETLQIGLKEISTIHNIITGTCTLYVNAFVCYDESCRDSSDTITFTMTTSLTQSL